MLQKNTILKPKNIFFKIQGFQAHGYSGASMGCQTPNFSKESFLAHKIDQNNCRGRFHICPNIKNGKTYVGAHDCAHGITLIALVVTIVVLLILAGITINFAISEGGIIAKANQAKEKQEIGQLKDQIGVNIADWYADKALYKDITIANLWDKLIQDKIITDAKTDVEGPDANGVYLVTTNKGYVIEVIIDDNGNVTIGEGGKKDELPPRIVEFKSTSKTTSSITVKAEVTRIEDGGKLSYYYKKSLETDYKALKENTTDKTADYTGLTQNIAYDLKLVVTNKNGSVDKTISVVTGELASGTISQKGTTAWSAGTASVELQTTDTTNTMQYQKNGIAGTWTNYGAAITGLVHGDVVYARMFDGINGSSPYSLNITDDVNPQTATMSLSSSTTKEGTPITATVTQIDNESGVNITSGKWVYNNTSGQIGTAESSYTGGTFSSNPQTISLNATTAGTYYLHVLTIDKAGNKKESISTPVTVEKKAVADGSYSDEKGVNTPKLGSGMTPIKWNGSSFVTTTPDDSSWYNYASKQWANAQTADGSQWVWIPRYAYQIASGWHSNSTGTINIEFMKGTTNTSSTGRTSYNNSTGQGNWNIHPAFEYGGQVSGIWVAKYEASQSNSGANAADYQNYTGGTSGVMKIQPNVNSWRNITIDVMYTKCLQYNSTLNSHQMKNIEWGAVAYLSKSKYGKENVEVGVNECNQYITGMGPAGSADVTGNTNYAYMADHVYNTTQGQKASTTGNVYGVYDMSGGSYEYTAAYVNNGSGNLQKYGASLVNTGVAKNKDVYTMGSGDSQVNNYNANAGKYGDAVYETSNHYSSDSGSWFGDYSYFPFAGGPFFLRGEIYSSTSGAGVFAFNYAYGNAYSYFGFRPVLVAN